MEINFEDIDSSCYIELLIDPDDLEDLLDHKARMIGGTDVFEDRRFYFSVKLKKEK